MGLYNDYEIEKLAKARVAEFYAEVDRDRLAREVAPHQVNPDRILILVAVIAVALGIVLFVL